MFSKNLCDNTVVLKIISKTFRNCSLKFLFRQNRARMGHTHLFNCFFLKITKGDHKFQELFSLPEYKF